MITERIVTSNSLTLATTITITIPNKDIQGKELRAIILSMGTSMKEE